MSQQLIIQSRQSAGAELAPLGDRRELIASLERYNTAPERAGEDELFGPGIRLELPPGQDTVVQMTLTIIEEEIAWLVIMRLARQFEWKILDLNTGRELSP